MSLLDALNPPQRRAVTTTEGPLLVLAGAGSGKTRVLTYRVAHLVHGAGVDPHGILAFTFTNKAAGEMKERVSYLLGGTHPRLWVGTFHATGVRILRRAGSAIGIDPAFVIYDTEDQEGLIRRILRDLNLADREISPKAYRSRISAAKNALLGPEEFARRAEGYRDDQVARVYGEYRTRLRAARALDFDDLIGETLRLFAEEPRTRDRFAQRFRYVLVDEYQDTNAAQVELIAHLASIHRNLCVVGDDDQSIYGWRGADVGNILSFESRYPEAVVIRLEQNYRSTGTILAAANAVVRHNRARKEKTLWTEREPGDPLTLTVTPTEEAEADRVVAAVTAEVREHGVPLSGTAVLYRTNAQSRALETAFRRAALPYELVGGVAFYQRREVKDLLAYLRVLVNPEDDLAFARILNVPRRGIGATTLERLAEHARREGTSLAHALASAALAPEFGGAAREKLERFARLLEDLRSRLEAPVDEVLRELVERVDYLEYLSGDDPDSATERVENVRELVAGAQAFTERSETPDVVSFLSEVALLTDIDRTEEGAESVRLMTMHNAKGLEFRVVCVAGLEEGLLQSSSLETEDDVEEERRLFYVAVTRGMDRVHLFAASSRQRWGGALGSSLSRFVEEIPGELLMVEEAPTVSSWVAPARESRPGRGGGASGPRRSLGTIRHPTFGLGDVVDREGNGPEARLTVIFAGNVRKKIVARYAEWEESHVDL